MLVILGGLPGTGKTTLAQELARRLGAVHLRVDSIEGELFLRAGADEVGDLGYRISHHLAADNLAVGRTVIADQVNDSEAAREGWVGVAEAAGAPCCQIELICSDKDEWRRRLARRDDAVPWEAVVSRAYDPWPDAASIDTAGRTPEEVAEDALRIIAG